MTDIIDAPSETVEEVVTSTPQVVLGDEFNIHTPFSLEVNIHLWEEMTESSITTRINTLKVNKKQYITALEKVESEGKTGNADWLQLDAQVREHTRQIEYMETHVVVGMVQFKAKTKGHTDITVGAKWDDSLDRHVIVKDGIISRVLPRSPI